MRTIPFCSDDRCTTSLPCVTRRLGDRWFRHYWIAASVATFRARSTGCRQQVRRGDVGWGRGWLVQEIR